MEYTIINNAGYNKDKIASFLFFISIIFVYYLKSLDKIKNLIIFILIIGFLIDFSYTVNPEYHFTKLGYNIPTYILYAGFISVFLLLIIYRRNLKF